MAMDFTVIQPVRQRFGDDNVIDGRFLSEGEEPLEQEAPFVGQSKEFSFVCPRVDRNQMGVLQFESLAVTAGRHYSFSPEFSGKRNIIRINDVDIPGAITPAPWVNRGDELSLLHFWKSHSLIVPANILHPQNVLYIESVPIPISGGTTLDNFIIDNIVVFFKTSFDGSVVGRQS